MIQGIGIDLVENERIEKIISKWGHKFLQRVFSEGEINYCGRHIQSSLHYGARFAAKEAFLKALGIGLGRGVQLREIEVVHNDQGKPDLSTSWANRRWRDVHSLNDAGKASCIECGSSSYRRWASGKN